MKKMLLGILLMVLSVWCLIYGQIEDLMIASLLGVALPIPALVSTYLGFKEK